MKIQYEKGTGKDDIPVRFVLVSVSDKKGLERLIPGLKAINPEVRFLSTGGTYAKLQDILGDEENLIEVSAYTEFPEMDGGLVKTLHPKIHAGILGSRHNPKHLEYLELAGGGEFIDMAVVNLYPFEKVIEDEDTPFEAARSEIDIGGPTMVRGAAKNFPSCAVLIAPAFYNAHLVQIKGNDGCTTFDQRARLAARALNMIVKYDDAIADYMDEQITNNLEEIRAWYLAEGDE